MGEEKREGVSGGEFDLRGPQVRIGRLSRFYMEGFIHMLFNRILAPYALIFGVVTLSWQLGVSSVSILMKPMILLLWVLFTPQFLETVKGLSMASSRGIAFGHLNPEFAFLYRTRYKKSGAGYKAVFSIVAALWVVSLILLLVVLNL